MQRHATVLAVALLVTACAAEQGGGSEAVSTPSRAASIPVSASNNPSEAATSECQATPESAVAIGEGLTVSGGGTLRDAFAVPLPAGQEFGFLHVVAAEIDGSGMEGDGEIGTWAVGELGGGPIFAVNAFAQEFSEWGADAAEGSPADVARDAVGATTEARTAEECVRAGM